MAQFLGFGSGSDGVLTVSSATTHAPIDASCSGTAGATSLSATNESFAAGQFILIHQSRGTGAGQWEINKISSYTEGAITTVHPLDYTYTDSGSSQAQVIVMPQYSGVTISDTLTAKAWDGNVGGIVPFLCNGIITVSGSITASGKGYRGGSGTSTNSPGVSGEGTSGAGSSVSPQVGFGGSANNNGNGGGGGMGRWFLDGTWHRSAGGAGGGNGAAGSNGQDYNDASRGSAGGYGGSSSGVAALTTATFGGGGGEGGCGDNPGASPPGAGGNGGGIVLMFSKNLVVTGSIVSGGSNGGVRGDLAKIGDDFSGSGGGGAGGSVLIKTVGATLGSNLITAPAGSGGAGSNDDGAGGTGAVGRIRVESCSLTGTTSPTASSVAGGMSYCSSAAYIV